MHDLDGQRFGRLTVIGGVVQGNDGRAARRCRCDCGNETCVRTRRLTAGITKSCGCLEREKRTVLAIFADYTALDEDQTMLSDLIVHMRTCVRERLRKDRWGNPPPHIQARVETGEKALRWLTYLNKRLKERER